MIGDYLAVAFFVALFLAWVGAIVYALRTGKVANRGGLVRRDESPRLFLFVLAGHCIAASVIGYILFRVIVGV